MRNALRRPALIVAEVVAIAAAAAVAASLPQEPEAEQIRRFAEASPALARLTSALRLHSVLDSPWFLALVGLALISLALAQVDQWRHLFRVWRGPLDRESFARAPFRRERPVAESRAPPPSSLFVRSGRLGLLGSPIFHLGLVVTALAGLLRLLYFADAGARLMEGETLPAGAASWQAQRAGPLAGPFELSSDLRLDEVRVSLYDNGDLNQISARVTLLGPQSSEAREMAINAPLEQGARSIYLLQDHGLAALFAHRTAAGEAPRMISLEPVERELRGGLRLPDGREIRARAARADGRPEQIEVRVLRGPALVLVQAVSPGQELALGDDETLRLAGLAWWATLRATRDFSRPLFFAGVSLGILGIALLLGVVPVETGVFVQGDRLVVALKAQRFAPLYAERFEDLCREWNI